MEGRYYVLKHVPRLSIADTSTLLAIAFGVRLNDLMDKLPILFHRS